MQTLNPSAATLPFDKTRADFKLSRRELYLTVVYVTDQWLQMKTVFLCCLVLFFFHICEKSPLTFQLPTHVSIPLRFVTWPDRFQIHSNQKTESWAWMIMGNDMSASDLKIFFVSRCCNPLNKDSARLPTFASMCCARPYMSPVSHW